MREWGIREWRDMPAPLPVVGRPQKVTEEVWNQACTSAGAVDSFTTAFVVFDLLFGLACSKGSATKTSMAPSSSCMRKLAAHKKARETKARVRRTSEGR